MSDVLYFNGRFTNTDERVLRVEDRGFLFGDGVYEVFKFLGGRPVFLAAHWRRLCRSLAAIDIRNPWDEASFNATMRELLERTSFGEGTVYIEVSRGEGERAHFYQDDLTPTAIAFSRRAKFPDAAKTAGGVRLITTSDIRWKQCDVKSVNLLANALAKKKAQRANADEALFIDGDVITECASANFFVVKDRRVATTPLDENILPGVTRDRVVTLARGKGFTVDERPVERREIDGADEIFITSTTLGVMPVRQIDDGPAMTRGPVTEELQRILDDAELRDAALPGA